MKVTVSLEDVLSLTSLGVLVVDGFLVDAEEADKPEKPANQVDVGEPEE